MKTKSYVLAAIIAVAICAACSSKSISAEARFVDEMKAAGDASVALQARVRAGDFAGIYKDSAFCIKHTHSELEFVERMNAAVNELRKVDPELNFRNEKILDGPPPRSYSVVKGYRVGKPPSLNADPDQHKIVNISWQNEGGVLRLTGFEVSWLENEFFKSSGTSFCDTTENILEQVNGGTRHRATIVVDSKLVKQIITTP